MIHFADPTGRAFSRMKAILFNPFDAGKWFVLGFSAWLATLFESSYSGGNSGSGGGDTGGGENGDGSFWEGFGEFAEGTADWIGEHWVWVAAAAGIVIVVVLVLSWVSSRAKFVLLDNVFHDRALVVVPWREYRKEGNSRFRWALAIDLASISTLLLILAGIATVALPYLGMLEWSREFVIFGCFAASFGLGAIFLLGYARLLLEEFVVPLMYRDRSRGTEAWRKFLGLHGDHLFAFPLYCLWFWMLAIFSGIVILVFGLATSCIGFLLLAIPYLGAVVLLPVTVFFRCLGPEFLRQFGSEFEIFPLPVMPGRM